MSNNHEIFFSSKNEIKEKNQIQRTSEISTKEISMELNVNYKKIHENTDEEFLTLQQKIAKNQFRGTTEMTTNEYTKYSKVVEINEYDDKIFDQESIEFEENYKFMFPENENLSHPYYSKDKINIKNENNGFYIEIEKEEKKQNNINNINKLNEGSVNKTFNFNLFNVTNKKRGRCTKNRGNNLAKHTNASCDDCYKKIIHKASDSAVKDINKIIKNKNIKIQKLNKITGIEKNYEKNLLEQPIRNILTNYRRVFTKNEKEENSKIIEVIQSDEEIKKILDMKFHVYTDEYMKKNINNIEDKKEKKTWELISEKGIYDFCCNRKLRKKRKKN